jgi:hypothetical protein
MKQQRKARIANGVIVITTYHNFIFDREILSPQRERSLLFQKNSKEYNFNHLFILLFLYHIHFTSLYHIDFTDETLRKK